VILVIRDDWRGQPVPADGDVPGEPRRAMSSCRAANARTRATAYALTNMSMSADPGFMTHAGRSAAVSAPVSSGSNPHEMGWAEAQRPATRHHLVLLVSAADRLV
jgi:hypothetical protein